ncbi:DUF262 domain-containing protein [Thalassolituus marinus]|uniref:DUF262 domain-containing protein n=1 Tax=Thalassolituus marinus TaxID=671053 RepID=A0ABS7ZSF4_9GAMM|nr:DUF262 domain-containing protein [Thalassolituus marinus]MCA6064540.1 DUF262 domain-containing protein [Thalassolituus marinus]
MENSIHSLQNLFKLSFFAIPQYQRAYAWDADKQVATFLDDLRQQVFASKTNPDKTYFLGTLLLHDSGADEIHIVDGQQRLTTSVIFIAAALAVYKERQVFNSEVIKEKKLREYFIYSEVEDRQKFQTIKEDDPFFRSQVLGIHSADISDESPSSRRLKSAFDFFLKNVGDEEWGALLETLINAQVMIYAVSTAADATLIFELQNDRGKRLTDLESLKSYLMHLVYLNAKNPDDSLREIQTQFSKIYRCVEKLDAVAKAPSEDAILAYHAVAWLSWVGDEWRNPKALIKKNLAGKSEKAVTDWILTFVAELHETYKSTLSMLSELDNYAALAELFVLDRMAVFWPLVLKTYKKDKSAYKHKFHLACRLMEVYAMRGFGISNLRADAGLSTLYLKAKEFNEDFDALFSHLHSMSYWYDIEERFLAGLDRPNLYKINKRDTRYLLWRYENHLRSQPGKQVGALPWKQFMFPANDASRLSIEHIAAQNNPIASTEVEWNEGDIKLFSEVALHRLGNLVLDSKSANSSKGKYDFTDKLESLSNYSTFLSQGELIRWAEPEGEQLQWHIEAVQARHEHMKSYAIKAWNPNNYYTPKSPMANEEQELDEDLCI